MPTSPRGPGSPARCPPRPPASPAPPAPPARRPPRRPAPGGDRGADQVTAGRLAQRAEGRPAPRPDDRGRRISRGNGLSHEVPERGGDIPVEFLAGLDHPVIVE